MLRGQTAFALVALSSFTVAAQEATPIQQSKVGVSAPLTAAGEIEAPAAAGCTNGISLSTSGGGSIKRYKLSYLYAYTEYRLPPDCSAVSPGSWTLNSQQKCNPPKGAGETCGKVTFGKLTGYHLANGDCKDHTYTFAAICYTWNAHNNWEITDKIGANWTTPDGDFNLPFQFPIKVPIVYPTSETTKGVGWDTNANGDWLQKLHSSSDSTFDWSWNSVQETDPGPDDPTNDTCWCQGSAIKQFYKITGGIWYGPTNASGDFGPQKDGSWGYDHVGLGYNAYRYYRQKQRVPCGTHFPQQMQFQATNVGGPWQNYGDVNTLGGYVTDTNIRSMRAGQSLTAPFEPQATKPRVACGVTIKPSTAVAAFGASIAVSDPRPVAAAIDEIEKVSGRPITYEDPPFQNKYHMTPMVEGGSGDPSLLVPRGGDLRFTLPANASAAQAVAAVQSMVGTYNAGHGVATFSVLQDGLTHVVPRQTLDPSGRLVPVTPVLDTKITLAAKLGSAMELLEEICRAVSAPGGRPVEIGTVPTNALRTRQIEVGAADKPAREVLEKLIAASGMPLSWRLLYDPGLKTYYLNIAVVQRSSAQP